MKRIIKANLEQCGKENRDKKGKLFFLALESLRKFYVCSYLQSELK